MAPFKRNFPENGAKMVPDSKFKHPVNKLLPKLVEKLISKFQIKILKNVGGIEISVTEIEQKAQMEIQLIL